MTISDIPVLLDHQDFIAVHKPAGISVQNEQDAEGILPRLCAQLSVPKLWLVHRLDKVTSGILLLAKHREAASALSSLFASRSMEKYYLAISAKKPNKKQGAIVGDMQKSRDTQWMLTKSLDSPAITQFFSKGLGQGYRLFILKPFTGKTHQIRVALKSLGSPILGDELYKGHKADRTYLHAVSLSFDYQGEPIRLLCPPSDGDYFTRPEALEVMTEFTPPDALQWPALNRALLQKVTGNHSPQDTDIE